MNLDLMKTKPKKVEKEWGHEKWLFNDEKLNLCNKILHIKKGHKGSCHFHDEKRESMYVLNGKCRISIHDMTANPPQTHKTVMEPGDVFFIDRLVAHQIEALEDTDIIEVSTFHRDEDSYRLWR